MTSGNRGRALVHLRAARSERSQSDTDALAGLLLKRALLRLDDGDEGATSDTAEASALEVSAAWKLEFAADLEAAAKRAQYALAVASYRRSDPRSRARAASLLSKASSRFGADPRSAAVAPQTASRRDLGIAGRWLADGRAKRRALEVLDQYVARGGTEPSALAAHRQLLRWWGRAAETTEIANEPVSLIAAALDDWLSGRTDSWLANHAQALGDIKVAEMPLAIRPSLLRSRGDRIGAEAALSKALSADALSNREIAILRMESAVLGRQWPPERRLSGRLAVLAGLRAELAHELGKSSENAANRVANRVARASLCQRTGVAIAPDLSDLDRARFCLSVGDIAGAATWDRTAVYASQRLAMVEDQSARLVTHPTKPRWLAPLGSPDPVRIADRWKISERTMVEIARLYAGDPVVAERFAHDALGRELWPRALSGGIVEFFTTAGDPRRAQQFSEELLELSPENPELIYNAAVLAARLGDSAQARVLAVKAAARSGDSGATLRELTESFAADGGGLEAIWAGKRALMLSAPVHRIRIRRTIALQMLRIGRRRDAEDLLRNDPHRTELLAIENASEAQLRRAAFERRSRAERTGWLGRFPTDAACVLALVDSGPLQSDASNAKNRAVLLQGLAWNSGNLGLLAAMARRRGSAGEQAYLRFAALAIYSGVAAQLRQWAELASELGKPVVQAAATREAQLPQTWSPR